MADVTQPSVASRDSPPAMRWWGWGDRRSSPGTARACAGVPAQDGRCRAAPAPAGRARSGAARAIGALRSGGGGVARDRRRRGYARRSRRTGPARRRQGLSRSGAGCAPGRPEGAPDAVVRPADREQLRAVLDRCARLSVAVVPWGGGTSVVGGVAPLRGEHAAVIALDMGSMARVLELDRQSRIGHRAGRHPRAGAGAGAGGRADSRWATSRSPTSTSRWEAARRRARPDRHRADMAGSSRWCSGCASRRPRARSSWPPSPPAPRARSCAGCWSARRERWG